MAKSRKGKARISNRIGLTQNYANYAKAASNNFAVGFVLLGRTKVLAVATDAKPRVEINLLNLCRGAKEENSKLTDAFIPRRLAAPSGRQAQA